MNKNTLSKSRFKNKGTVDFTRIFMTYTCNFHTDIIFFNLPDDSNGFFRIN